MGDGITFKPGERVPRTGLYAVSHRSHRERHDATLLEGELFPSCAQCDDDVAFELLHSAVPIAEDADFKPLKRRARARGRH